MCVAVLQKAGAKTLTRQQIETGWRINSDGGGFAYINRHTGRITVYKTLSLVDFIKEYESAHARHGDESPFIVHLRMATHGMTNVKNVHPFRIKTEVGETVYAHNGIIQHVPDDKKYSDTAVFARLILDDLPDDWLDNPAIVELVEEYIGWSKLVFLTTSPDLEYEWYIINEDSGFWRGDTWFSNNSCEKSAPKALPAGTTYYYKSANGQRQAYSYAWDGDDYILDDHNPNAWAQCSYCGEWERNTDLDRETGQCERCADPEPVWHAFFPDGNGLTVGLNEATLQQLEADAEASGHCLTCWHAPCQCKYMCWECERHSDVCECEAGPLSYEVTMKRARSIHDLDDKEVSKL